MILQYQALYHHHHHSNLYSLVFHHQSRTNENVLEVEKAGVHVLVNASDDQIDDVVNAGLTTAAAGPVVVVVEAVVVDGQLSKKGQEQVHLCPHVQ
jgi:hypothetical protein